jgi:hypothetical protein
MGGVSDSYICSVLIYAASQIPTRGAIWMIGSATE